MQIKTKTDATTKLKEKKKKKPRNQHLGLARFSTKTIEKVPTEILFIINLSP